MWIFSVTAIQKSARSFSAFATSARNRWTTESSSTLKVSVAKKYERTLNTKASESACPHRVMVQIDVGFGDLVEPAPAQLRFPVLLPLDPPIVRGYPPETVIAEKFQAMVMLGIGNSRMKDFFDIWTLARTRPHSAVWLNATRFSPAVFNFK